jgi:hypothetical protein
MLRSASLLFACAILASCAQPQQTAVNPLTQPLGASKTVAAAEPSPAAMEKMKPYLAEKVYSNAVPMIEMWPFRECYGRAIYANMSPAERTEFERLVSSGEIYNDSVIIKMTRYFNSAIASPSIRSAAGQMCPNYATAYRNM